MWMQVVIIALGFYGFWVFSKATGARIGGLWAFVRGFPIWLAVLAVPVALAAKPLLAFAGSSLGSTPDGKPITSKSWLQEGDAHYVLLNRTVRVPITEAEYMEEQRAGYATFATAWILFSYLLLVLWQYNWRRERLGHVG